MDSRGGGRGWWRGWTGISLQVWCPAWNMFINYWYCSVKTYVLFLTICLSSVGHRVSPPLLWHVDLLSCPIVLRFTRHWQLYLIHALLASFFGASELCIAQIICFGQQVKVRLRNYLYKTRLVIKYLTLGVKVSSYYLLTQ